MKISFIVPGNPQGKARPRVCRVGGKSITYTPNKTVEYEKLIRTSYNAVLGVKFEKNVPLEMNILALFSIPKKSTKKFSGKVPLPSREQSLLKQKEILSRAEGSAAGELLENFKQPDCAMCPTARWPAKSQIPTT